MTSYTGWWAAPPAWFMASCIFASIVLNAREAVIRYRRRDPMGIAHVVIVLFGLIYFTGYALITVGYWTRLEYSQALGPLAWITFLAGPWTIHATMSETVRAGIRHRRRDEHIRH